MKKTYPLDIPPHAAFAPVDLFKLIKEPAIFFLVSTYYSPPSPKKKHALVLQRRPLPFRCLMHGRIPLSVERGAVETPDNPALHNIPVHAAQHGSPSDGGPRIQGLDDVDEREGLAVKVRRDLLAQVLAAAEAADQEDRRHRGAAGVRIDAL